MLSEIRQWRKKNTDNFTYTWNVKHIQINETKQTHREQIGGYQMGRGLMGGWNGWTGSIVQ